MAKATRALSDSSPSMIQRPPFLDQFHLAARSPPAVNFSGQCHPDFLPLNYLAQIFKQRLVNFPRVGPDQVIRMGDETHEPVSLVNHFDLLFPKINRIIVQYLEERIILDRSQRNLQYFADEVWEDRTAAAALRFQMGDIWHGHVIGKVIRIIPIEIAIHDSGTKATRVEFLDVFINSRGSLQKLLPFLIQLPIMIQVVYIELESTTLRMF